MKVAVIFGGNGFIGSFFAKHLVEEKKFSKVYIFDCESLSSKDSSFRRALLHSPRSITQVIGDVRSSIDWRPKEHVNLIANFAAVHREPGHEGYEYYETNLRGAENVCAWAEKVGCNNLIFTSSIAPYGPSESPKDEESLPVPISAYGCSKLVAEEIHQKWLAADADNRHLVIVRPGVVFGPGEGGNVSRLIKAVLNRYFFYMGNQDTRKAGTYVKELCAAISWVLERQIAEGENFSLFNMSMNPGPSIKDYVAAVASVSNMKVWVPTVPYGLLLMIAYGIDTFARPFGIKHPFSPVRIRKLVRSNNIEPRFLMDNGYEYRYSLESAFADWRKECPEEW
ncbi:NAD(P)-dependent oxidoreductase [Marinobacter sp. ST-43]|uniref:NAD-dependent epimerase/dehydratase family protein n=1 Tax=Marinobacter sp. ST-43 TaxID=3050453 RepID=UPI0026DF0186|nr:NAD(P)-dependent oxidoreductase [Marinobacter sp. ST-43]